MSWLVVVNRVEEIVPTQTTAMLIEAARCVGLRVQVCGVADLSWEPPGRVVALARAVPERREASAAPRARGADPAPDPQNVAWSEVGASAPRALDLTTCERVLVRTNPGRDLGRAAAHRVSWTLLAAAKARGVAVINDPDGLARASDKALIASIAPEHCPEALVTGDARAVVDFVRARGAGVLKPLQGSRGRDVFRVTAADVNLRALAEALTREGPGLVQALAPGAEGGDVRLVLLDGRPLEVDGHVAAIRRVPALGDFRSNLHAGGRAEPAALDATLRGLAAAVGPKLVAHGLRLVGLDVIGAQIIELNAFSTGGLRDAERFTGVDFAGALVAAFREAC